MTKLKQVCNHPALLLHDGSPIGRRSGKIARLEEILAEVLAAGDKALLFTQYAAFGDMLAPHLAARFDTEVAWLHGGVSRKARDTMVERFQGGSQEGDKGGLPLFLLSLRAGGTGITLTAAQHVVHLDRWWNPAVEDQATDRAYRIGQKRTVRRPQARHRGDAGGAHRRPHRRQARAGRPRGARRRGLARRPVHRRPREGAQPGRGARRARAGGGGRRRWCVRPAPALGSRSASPRVMPSTASASPSRTVWSPAAAGARSGSPGGRGASSPS